MKKLLNHIRVGNIKKYLSNNYYSKEIENIKKDIDFSVISWNTKIIFKLPIKILILYYSTKKKIVSLYVDTKKITYLKQKNYF